MPPGPLLKTIRDDLRAKARWCYQSDRPGAVLRAALTDGSGAMVLYRLMQWSRRRRLAPLEMLFNKLISLLCHCIIGRGADFGPELVLIHSSGVVINGAVRGGRGIHLEHQVTLGAERRQSPVLGDGIFIGAGAKVIGGIHIGDGVRIGANAVVLGDIPAFHTAVGIPARAIPPTSSPTEEPLRARRVTHGASILETGLAAAFWCCAAGIMYTYLAYPALICGLSRLFGRQPTPPADNQLPRLALLIAAHNEAEVLDERIQNALALDYPADRLDIVIASDGSDDDTARICRRYEGRIRPFLFPSRRGKAATLTAAIAQIDADIIALSDANTHMDRAAPRNLARWFADPHVGAVCGRLNLIDSVSGRNADGLYWRYETFLKTCEGRLSALLGANGAIYAIRRSLFPTLPAGTIVDDFVIPLLAKLRTGCQIVYDPEAIAHEETPPDLRCEFGRRTRIGIGGWQALSLLWPLLSPRHGWTALSFWSHKVLRWVCPFLMLGALITSAALAHRPLYAAALAFQLAFYALGIAAALAPPGWRAFRRLRLCSMFAMMNLALLVGFARWLASRPTGIWRRTSRVTSATA